MFASGSPPDEQLRSYTNLFSTKKTVIRTLLCCNRLPSHSRNQPL